MMQKTFQLLVIMLMWCLVSPVFAQEITDTNSILSLVATNPKPNTALVERYYAIEDLRQAVLLQAPQSPYLSKLNTMSKDLRKELDAKKLLRPLSPSSLALSGQYRSGVLSKDKVLDKPCPQFQTLVDDWSFALDLPSSLVTATWLMESGCGWTRPANGDGIFQIVSRDYGTGVMTTGHWIWMMTDFNDFVRAKFTWYNTANKVNNTLPFNYQFIDFTGVVRFGALYNGLSGWTVKWDIQPISVNYVYGKLNENYSGAVKDGLLVRVMKAMK